jgi:mono/diheme cytochrome c family protein
LERSRCPFTLNYNLVSKPIRVCAVLVLVSVAACQRGDVEASAHVGQSAATAGAVPSSAPAAPSVAASAPAPSAATTATAATPALPAPPAPTPAAGAPDAGAVPVFTKAQAARGEAVYKSVCVRCHVTEQFKGGAFTATWQGRRVFDLYDLVSGSMPQDDPGSLTNEQYIDVVAYVLGLNGAAAGKKPLPLDDDVLRRMRIGVKPASK